MTDPVKIIVGEGSITEVNVPEYNLIQTGGGGGGGGSDGATFFPEVSEEGVISWTNDGGYDNPDPVNIKGPAGNDGNDGNDGEDGTTFTPAVDASGNLSWTNDGGKQNPQTVNIKGPAGNDGNDGEDGVSPTVTFTTITGGHTMTVTDKDHPSGQSINIMDGTSGGGGTSDYDDLTDKPSINNVTLSGNKTAAELGLGTYTKPSGGIPQSDLASAVQNKLDKTVVVSNTQPTAVENKLWVDADAGAGSTYQVPTVAEMEAADAQVAAEIGIVITGKRPSTTATAGQYVIVRNSTISGITDGLYTAKDGVTLSPSTDVTGSDLTAVNDGGLNSLGAYVTENFAPYNQIMVTGYSTYKMTLPSLSGHFVFIVGSSLSRSAILYIVVQNSGAVAVEEIQKGTNFTYTLGTNELTFGNGATYAIHIKEIPIRGDPISVEPIS